MGAGLALWGWTACLELDWGLDRQVEYLGNDCVGYCTVTPEGGRKGRRVRVEEREGGSGVRVGRM